MGFKAHVEERDATQTLLKLTIHSPPLNDDEVDRLESELISVRGIKHVDVDVVSGPLIPPRVRRGK